MTTRDRQGSILLLTLFLVVLAAFALSRFIEKAYAEILAESLYTERDRLRIEAYSALETTIAVLYNVNRMDQNLHDPAQGWSDPLGLAGVQLSDGIDVRVEFTDEMGKISLPAADRDRLLRLFEVLGFDAIDSQELADALLGWMNREAAESSFEAHHLNYERAELPYQPPYRSLKSFSELAAIEGFRDAFFSEQGVPNARFDRLVSLVSLYQFEAVNVNAASPEVLQIWSDVSEHEADYLESHRQQVSTGEPYFRDLGEAAGQLGLPLDEGYGVATQCLRVNITVSDGAAEFALSAVVAPSARAGTLLPPAPEENRETPENSRAKRRARQPEGQNADRKVPYPFTFLELRENETIL